MDHLIILIPIASCISSDKFLINGNCIDNNINYFNLAALFNTTDNTLLYNIIKKYILPLYELEYNFQIVAEGSENVVFQITTAKNQLKALMNNSLNNYDLSILDISNCETILKRKI